MIAQENYRHRLIEWMGLDESSVGTLMIVHKPDQTYCNGMEVKDLPNAFEVHLLNALGLQGQKTYTVIIVAEPYSSPVIKTEGWLDEEQLDELMKVSMSEWHDVAEKLSEGK